MKRLKDIEIVAIGAFLYCTHRPSRQVINFVVGKLIEAKKVEIGKK